MSKAKTDKALQTYTRMFGEALEKEHFADRDAVLQRYSERLAKMYRSEKYREHDVYPTMDMPKIYAVIAMCLTLREAGLSDEEIIDFVNFVFRKLKRVVHGLISVIDTLPCAYRIAERWNLNDHEKRVQDGSVIYDYFRVEDGRIEYSISKCMFVEIFACYGIRELCKIFCMTDTQGYAGLTRHVEFTRYADLSDGDCCHDVIARR